MSAPIVMHVHIDLVEPQCIQIQAAREGPTWQRLARVHDVEQALDQLEAWLWPTNVRASAYQVAVSVAGLDGVVQQTVWPNRHLALYFIATTLAHARPAQLTHRWRSLPDLALPNLALPNVAQGAE